MFPRPKLQFYNIFICTGFPFWLKIFFPKFGLKNQERLEREDTAGRIPVETEARNHLWWSRPWSQPWSRPGSDKIFLMQRTFWRSLEGDMRSTRPRSNQTHNFNWLLFSQFHFLALAGLVGGMLSTPAWCWCKRSLCGVRVTTLPQPLISARAGGIIYMCQRLFDRDTNCERDSEKNWGFDCFDGNYFHHHGLQLPPFVEGETGRPVECVITPQQSMTRILDLVPKPEIKWTNSCSCLEARDWKKKF